MSSAKQNTTPWLVRTSVWVSRVNVDVRSFARYWQTIHLPEKRDQVEKPVHPSGAGLEVCTGGSRKTADQGVPLCGIPLYQIVAADGAIVDATSVA